MYVKDISSNTIVIEKSKFITFLMPCTNEEEYKKQIQETKKKYYDASHVCSAFIARNIRRSSDDGEPSGTAGVPIISTLDKSGIEKTSALVVRYFGGIKLGAGGLIRAYSSSVSEAIRKATFYTDEEYLKYELNLSYELANRVDYLLEKEAFNLTKEYENDVKFTYLSNDQKLLEKIKELTSGKEPMLLGKEMIQKVVKL